MVRGIVTLNDQKKVQNERILDPLIYRRFDALVRHGMLTQAEADQKIQELVKKEKIQRNKKSKKRMKRAVTQKVTKKERDKKKKQKKQRKHEADLMQEWYAKIGETKIPKHIHKSK